MVAFGGGVAVEFSAIVVESVALLSLPKARPVRSLPLTLVDKLLIPYVLVVLAGVVFSFSGVFMCAGRVDFFASSDER